ncbi:hypothetical protein RI367_008315 [Sorochytrium milnesiophthora]
MNAIADYATPANSNSRPTKVSDQTKSRYLPVKRDLEAALNRAIEAAAIQEELAEKRGAGDKEKDAKENPFRRSMP